MDDEYRTERVEQARSAARLILAALDLGLLPYSAHCGDDGRPEVIVDEAPPGWADAGRPVYMGLGGSWRRWVALTLPDGRLLATEAVEVTVARRVTP